MNADALWAELSTAGLVEGERPERAPAGSPWFVRAMLGITGWIGAAFLLAFAGIALASLLSNAAFAIIAGGLCCAGAFGLLRGFDGADFAEQFALALSLAGQGLLIVGLSQVFRADGAGFYLAIAVVEVVLALAVANVLHRLLAAAGAGIALAFAFGRLGLHGLDAPLLCAGVAAIWLDPARWATRAALWRPIGYGLVLALFGAETLGPFGIRQLFGGAGESGWMALHGPLIGRALTSGVLVWATAALSIREGAPFATRPFVLAVGAAIAVGGLCLLAPGLGAAPLVLLLGFAAGNRLLTALGVIGLLGFAAHFYYSLHATLLVKSGFLAVTGVLLLAASLFLRRGAPRPEDIRHA